MIRGRESASATTAVPDEVMAWIKTAFRRGVAR